MSPLLVLGFFGAGLEFALGFGNPPLAWQVLPTLLASHSFLHPILFLHSSTIAFYCSISSLRLDDVASLVKPVVVLTDSTLYAASCMHLATTSARSIVG